MSFYGNFFESGLNRGNSKIGVQNHNSYKNKNSNPGETMSIADFLFWGCVLAILISGQNVQGWRAMTSIPR